MQIAFGRVRRKTSPAVATEVGVRNPSHRLLKCPFVFGLHYKIQHEKFIFFTKERIHESQPQNFCCNCHRIGSYY